jgi:two-component system response regulator NreC
VSRLRVLLVDDNGDFLDGVRAWLERRPGVQVVGIAGSGRQAVSEVERLHPDLVLMDVTMPDMNGFEATRWIKGGPGAPIVVLMTFHDSDAARKEARGAGADDFVCKARFTEQLTRVIEKWSPRGVGDDATTSADRHGSSLPTNEDPPRDLSQ